MKLLFEFIISSEISWISFLFSFFIWLSVVDRMFIIINKILNLIINCFVGFSLLFLFSSYLILEHATVVYFKWVGDVISFTSANKAFILFEVRELNDLSTIHFSGARKSEFASYNFSSNYQLPCLNPNFSYCIPRNRPRLRGRQVSSWPWDLLSMKVDSLVDPYKKSVATLGVGRILMSRNNAYKYVYVDICIYIFICIYAYMCVHVYIYIYIYMQMYVCVTIPRWLYIDLALCGWVSVHVCVCVCMCVQVYSYLWL